MTSLNETVCPACGAGPGTLSIISRLVANPLGSHSLAGAQLKVSARRRPVLTCSRCPLRHVGEYDPDGRHATFPTPRAATMTPMPILQPGPRDLILAARGTGRIYPKGHYAQIRAAELTPAPQHVADAFAIEAGATVIRRERVHYVGAIALSVSTSWFDGVLAQSCPMLLERERIVEGTASYIAARWPTQAVARGRDVLAVIAADESTAALLDVPIGLPVQLVTTYWFDAADGVVEFGESISTENGITYDYAITP